MSNCAFTDASCVCASAQFQADAALCLTTHCTAEDLQTALALQTAQCTAAGITPSGTATPRTVPFTLASTNTATTPATSTDTATPAATSNAASGLTAGAGTVFGAVLAGVLAL
ncbi:unnamed protein product [Cyclocybe aegerita]|uniref:CFEM domain-containing protein n=1 Tax=Cyclocybe aegerita TaxID=1973307 RepID=A0A8S0VV08_CYCAE|nr:unnamed protein product [Cyclocybe aegerita]